MIAFIYSVSVILAFLLGLSLSRKKPKFKKLKKEEAITLKEIQNFLNYDGNVQE